MSEKGAKIAVESAKNVGKLFLNSFGEGSEEWIQSGMEITSSKYAKQGKILNIFEIFEKSLDFSHYTKEELSMMNDSFKAGMVIGIFSGGVKSATFGTANKIAETVNDNDMGNTIKGLSFSGEVIKKTVDYAKSSNSKENTALALEIEGKDIKDVSSKTLGKLAKNAIKDGVNIFKLNETTAENNSTSVELSKDISEYPYDMQTVIKDYVEYKNPRIREFINNVIQGTSGKRIYLENVTSRAVGKIKELLNINVENYKVSLDKNIVEHIIKRHGKDGVADKSMADISDFERIQYVLNNFDNIEYGGKSSAFTTIDENGKTRLADTVIYSKKINGTFYVVQAVPETKNKTLRIVSAYINKNGASQVSNSITPEETSETPTANTPINNSVPQPDNTVNNNSMQNIENNPEISKVISSLSRIMGGAETSEADIQALIQNPEVFEIYTGQKIKENAETEIRQYLEEMNKKNARANSIISAISDKTGLDFDYDITLPEKVAGFYDAKNKKIVLNPAHKDALDYAVVHELTHFVENKKGYSAYRKSLLKSNAYQEFLISENYADKKEFRTQLEEDYKDVYGHLSKDEFNEAIDYEIAAKISEYLINSEPAALKRLANKDTGFKAICRDIMEFFNEIIHKLSGESEKAYAMKMARKFRELVGDKDVQKGKEFIQYSNKNSLLTVEDEDAILKYKSSDSYKINEKLYSGNTLSDIDIKFVENLNSALDKLPKYKGKVYRNITFYFKGKDAFDEFVNGHIIGNEKCYNAFTSASKVTDGYEIDADLTVHIEIESITELM